MLKTLTRFDQHYSRLAPQLPLGIADRKRYAQAILGSLLPEAQRAEIGDFAETVVGHRGCGRALRQRVAFARSTAARQGSTLRDAFSKVHPLFVGSDYSLTAK